MISLMGLVGNSCAGATMVLNADAVKKMLTVSTILVDNLRIRPLLSLKKIYSGFSSARDSAPVGSSGPGGGKSVG